jgi:hypothetical protein
MNMLARGARSFRHLLAGVTGCAVCLATPAWGQCQPAWSDRWSYSSFASPVSAADYFDFGDGPELVVVGANMPAFTTPSQFAVKLAASGWVQVNAGVVSGAPTGVRVLDLGQGPRLFITGSFALSRGTSGTSKVAIWDGTGWSGLGNPGQFWSNGGILPNNAPLVSFDDGAGAALYAATYTGSQAFVRRWNGSAWETTATFTDASSAGVADLQVIDLGNGPELYAAGMFDSVEGVPANSIARWNGARWEAVGPAGLSGWIASLAVRDTGNGPTLYAGGPINLGRNSGTDPVVKLVDNQWTSVAPLPSGWDRGCANKLLSVGGTMWAILGSNSIFPTLARLDDEHNAWSILTGESVRTLTALPDGSGDVLFTGTFGSLPDVDIPYVATHNGQIASPVEPIGMGASTAYSAASVRVDGETRMYVADSRGVFRVDHGRNERLFPGPPGGSGADVLAGDFGRGPELFVRSSGLRRVDLTSGEIFSLPQLPGQGATYISFLKCPYNGREQPAVVAQASSGSAAFVYCWDGSAWIRMPGAFGGSPPVRLSVIAPQLSGWPELVAAGNFTSVDGQPIRSLAAYRDGAWQAIAGAPTGALGGAIMRHDPSGPKLVVAGRNAYSNRVGVWDGAAWTTEQVQVLPHVLTRFDDGNGPAIYALGSGVAVFRDGRWTYPNTRISGQVEYAYGADASDGGSLFVMGSLTKVADKVSRSVAEYVGCPTTCRADLNADGSADFSDYLDFAEAFSRGLPIADFHADGFLDYFDFAEFLSALDGGCQ